MTQDHRTAGIADDTREDPAFEQFLRDEHGPLVGFLTSKRISPEDAQDIAQESQIRLMRYRGQPSSALKMLLYRIALNLLRDKWRQRDTNHPHVHLIPTMDLYEIPTQDPGPDQRAAQLQDLARARDAIARLPSHCRRIYVLNRIEGMSYSQIARHTGVSVKAVEKQISKALSLLRESLASADRAPHHRNRTP